VLVHHVEMHEFWLWCDFKSLKKFCEKVLKNNCENWCKSLKKNESLNLKKNV
jgi:hypothetical protein